MSAGPAAGSSAGPELPMFAGLELHRSVEQEPGRTEQKSNN